MSLPAAYTEATLKAFIHTDLGAHAEYLEWTAAAGSYDEVVNDALAAYGASDIATITGATNIQKLRTLARVYAMRRVVNQYASKFDFSADGNSVSRSQLNAMAEKALGRYESEAMAWLPEYAVNVQRVDHPHNPYNSIDAEDRVL